MKKFIFLTLATLMTTLMWSQVYVDEDFSGGALPTGWNNIDNDGGGRTWQFNNPGSRDINGGNPGFDADFAILDSDEYGTTGAEDASLETPTFDASSSGSGTIFLSFDNSFRQYSGSQGEVLVYDGSTWNSVLTINSSDGYPNPANHKMIDITSAVGGAANAKVRFHYTGDFDYWWAVDNVTIENITCQEPTDLTVDNITANTADISWTRGGSENDWVIKYGAPGFDPTSEGEQTTQSYPSGNTNPPIAGLANLTQDTDYEFYVQANCGGGDGDSNFAGPVSFHTAVSCPQPTDLTVDDITANTADVSWTDPGSANQFTIKYGAPNFDPSNEGMSASGDGSGTTTLTGLTQDTEYEFYVQANCGGGNGDSNFAGPMSFRTDNNTIDFSISSGFNEDIIGEGDGPIANFTTNDFDNQGYYLISETYQSPNETGPASFALPADGLLANQLQNGPNYYQLKDYTGNNAFQLRTSSDAGSIVFGNPASVSKLYLLLSSSASDNVTITGTIDFQDGSTQSLGSIDVPNWYFSTDLPIAYQGFGRYNGNNGSYQPDSDNPRLYQVEVTIEAANVNKTVTGLTINRSDSDTGVFSLFAIEGMPTPSCVAPTALTVDGVSANTADISWAAGGSETDYVVQYSDTPNFEPTSAGQSQSVNGMTSTQLSGLAPNTTYEFYVQSDCGGGTSDFVGPVSFTTGCATVNAPWTYDVEDQAGTTNDEPVNPCWTANPNTNSDYSWRVTGTGTTTSSNTGPGAAHSGDKFFFTEATDGSEGDVAELLSPMIDVSSLTTPYLSFYYHMYGADMGELNVSVYDGSTWNLVKTFTGEQQANQDDDWLEATVTLTGYTGVIQLKFEGTEGADYTSDMAIDDIAIIETPTCPKPTDLTVDAVTQNTADISWTAGGSESSWNVSWGASGYTPGGTDEVGTATVTTTSYQITNLTAGTEYDVYVQADCGSGQQSTFAGPQGFSTPVANDEACTATAIACGDDITQSLSGATPSLSDSCFGSDTAGDVWFSFTSDGSQVMTIAETSSFDAVVQLFKGNDCGDLTEEGPCADNPENFEVTEAGTYYFRVRPYSYSPSDDDADIEVELTCITPPDNDDLCGATALTLGATSAGDAYTNEGATAQTGEPNFVCGTTDASVATSVWFTFVAPTSGNVTVSTDFPGDGTFDTRLSIYEAAGVDCTDLSTLGGAVGCDDDGGTGTLSIVSLTGLTSGDTYYVRVEGYSGDTGTFGLEVKDDGYVYVDDTEGWSPTDPAGNTTASDDITVRSGTANFDNDVVVNNLTVESGATLNVESVLTINGDITSDGDMVFKSTATSDGELAAVPSSSTITGNVTVERYMSDNRAFRFVSPAVTTSSTIHENWQEGASSATDDPNPGFGTHITGTYTTDQENGFDITASGNPSLYTLNTATQAFEEIGNTDVNTLTAGDNYLIFVRGSRAIDLTSNASHSSTVLRATGTLQTGSVTKSLGNVPNGNFVAVANPYQSSIDVNDVISGSTNLNGNYAYVYDPSMGSNGGYATVALPGGSASGSTANQYVQPGQAVQMASSGGSVDIVFGEADKAPGNHNTTFSNENPFVDNVHINGHLYTAANYAAGKRMHDNFSILFDQSFDNALNNRDAVKPMNFTENMGIGTPDNAYSVERRALPTEGEDIALFNTGYANQDYTLVMEVSDFGGTAPFLVDNYTGEETELQAGENVISFSVDQNVGGSTVSNRFHIRFKPSTLSVGSQEADYGIRLYPNPAQSGSAFYLTAGQFEGQSVKVGITDLLGKTVYSTTQQFNGGKIAIQPDSPLGSGVYFVRLSQDGKTVNKRLVVK